MTNIKCKNCEVTLVATSKFCNECGQKVITERYTVKHIFRQTVAIITNVDNGFWHTLITLFKSPAKVIRDYWSGKTVEYYHPFRYIFILASISVILALSINLYELQQEYMYDAFGIADDPEQLARQQKIQKVMSNYMNLIYLIIIPFVSLFTWLFYRKKGSNYAEHLIADTFIMAQTVVIGAVTLILYALKPAMIKYGIFLGIGVSAIYSGFVYKKLFNVKWLGAFTKALLSIVLGYLTMFLAVSIITIVVVIIYILISKVF